MEQILVTDLVEKAQRTISTYGYKSSTIRHYNRHWANLKQFFENNGEAIFSTELSDKFVAIKKAMVNKGLISSSYMRGIKRAVYFLQECYIRNENITWERIHRHVIQLDDAPNLLTAFERYKCSISTSLSNGSVNCYCKIVESFLIFLKKNAIYEIDNIKQNDMKDFIKNVSVSRPKGMHVVLPALRSFLRFIIKQDPTLQPLLWAIPQNAGQKSSIVNTVTQQELQKLDSFIRQNGPSPKRNYTIFLLASRMGLRQSDIAGLKLGNIDWRNSMIKIIQQKNSAELVLPLLPEVGNSLVDYILNERPDTSNGYVFIRHLAPHEKISSALCSNIVRLAMKYCGIHEEKGMSQGIHCLRHTVAQKMLAESVPLSDISFTLGHKDKNSTKKYLSVDTKKLRFCALGLSGIEVEKEELR